MNVTAFCKILREAALLYGLGNGSGAQGEIEDFVARLKPYGSKPLPRFFTLDSTNRQRSRDRFTKDAVVSVSTLAKIIEQSSRLLRAAGSTAKANELAEVANDVAAHEDVSLDQFADDIDHAQAAETQRVIDGFVGRLNKAERETEGFEKIVGEIGQLNAQLAIRVAAAYVEGRSKYASKAKALAAIRNKQYAQERFLHKTGKV